MKEYLSKQKDDIYIIYMRVCRYLFIYREREEERLRMIFGGTFLLPEASTYLLKYNSLQRAVLLTLIWNCSPSIVLAKVQSYLWHLPALLSDPNIMIILTLIMPCHAQKKHSQAFILGANCWLVHREGREIQQILLSQVRLFSNSILMYPGSFLFFLCMDNGTWGFLRKIHSYS